MSLLERERELAAIEKVLAQGGVLVVEGGAGIGKTSLLNAAAGRAKELGQEVLRARGSEVEADFAFGVVRQLFERRLAAASRDERRTLLAGHAGAARPLLTGRPAEIAASDTSFSVLHGLYWLAVNLASARPLLVAVDDAHWADPPSLRWLAYLAPRVEGLPISVLVATRPAAGEEPASLAALRAEARLETPQLLSEAAAATLIRDSTAAPAGDELCRALWQVSGGNPFYLSELLRGLGSEGHPAPGETEVPAGVREGVARQVATRIRRLDADALRLAQAVAVLGDGCELRQAAALADTDFPSAVRLAATLVNLEILAAEDPPRFLHPIIRDAVEASIGSHERDAAHRAAAHLLHAEGASPGRVAAHLLRLRPAGDGWVVARLRDAAAAAVQSGAPQAGAELLERALAEPPAAADRATLLLESGRAESLAGRAAACTRLEQARALTEDRRQRAEIGLQLVRAHADLFQWVEAVDVSRAALAELGDAEPDLQAKLAAQIVVAGLRDARRVADVAPALEQLARHRAVSGAAEPYLLARGMTSLWIDGRPAAEVRAPIEAAFAMPLAGEQNWDTRGPAAWALVFAEGFGAAQSVLAAMQDEVERSGSARGMFTTFATLGLLNLRLGSLPEAETAARVVLGVMEAADFVPGLPLLVTVLADIAVEAGQLDEAQAALDLLPAGEVPPGLGTVQPVAALGRLRLAQGRPAEAHSLFEKARSLFGPESWGLPVHDNGFLHARSGAAQALLQLGERDRARELADQELADARRFGAPRALGVALRTAGMTWAEDGIPLLEESVALLRSSPARLELGHSLCELGAALRRSGRRAAAREPLAEALELAARSGARRLGSRVREELNAAGSRPRREWRTGAEALTPSELRVARLAAEGRTNREIAQTLYVSPKTVEGHLARVYDKLQITRRAELAQGLEPEKTGVSSL